MSRRGDILLVCPPFEGIDRPSLGLHLLQTIGRNRGLKCDVWYANLSLANVVDEGRYLAVAYGPPLDLLGERLFAKHAYPEEPVAPLEGFVRKSTLRSSQERSVLPDISAELHAIEVHIGDWLAQWRQFIRSTSYRVYGFTTMFAQNLATSCLCRIAREEKPDAIIIVGGANCEGEMASGINLLCPDADYIFSGESEASFDGFCRALQGDGELPSSKVVVGGANSDWQRLGLPDYQEYFSQLQDQLPDSSLLLTGQIFVPYETSRGCWWGQKNHCTFCGLNANGMDFRPRDAKEALRDIVTLSTAYPQSRIGMTDNIMPASYFKDLLPSLAALPTRPSIFYEQKSNLKRQQLVALKHAGVTSIQPGIEALSSSLLRRMRKGVSAAQNLSVLRDCRSLEMDPIWNLLYGFPGDEPADYSETLNLIPHLVHLQPPNGCSEVSYDRFSPYFDRPADFGISNLRPHPSYARAYPAVLAPVDKFAYHFTGDAASVVNHVDVVERLQRLVKAWGALWRQDIRPVLCVIESSDGYLLVDTRNEADTVIARLSDEVARAVTSTCGSSAEIPAECLSRKWVVQVDNFWVGLASTTSERLLNATSAATRDAIWMTQSDAVA